MSDPLFAMVPIEVLADKRLTLWQIKVLVGLLSFRNKNSDTVWPGRDALAERCGGMHVANISKTTSELCELGWLVKQGNGGNSRSAIYKIVVPDLVEIEKQGNPPKVAESTTFQNVAESTTQTVETVAESTTLKVADSARGIEQTIEHTNTATEESGVCASARELLAERGVAGDLAEKWLAIRESKGQVTDLGAVELVEDEATAAGVSFLKAVECCCKNGWAWFTAKWYAKLGKETRPGGSQGPPRPSAGWDWRSSAEGVLNRGRRLGIERLEAEPEDAYRSRVIDADRKVGRERFARIADYQRAKSSGVMCPV